MLLSELVIRDTDSVYCARLRCFVHTKLVLVGMFWKGFVPYAQKFPRVLECMLLLCWRALLVNREVAWAFVCLLMLCAGLSLHNANGK